ncbi:glycosyltransferase family 2 protein [Yoonia sp. 2307UL14-13]|uniref:glycosyltransferase family 2 protein n=1 Tax=Yoonia sp. 2307UL14-13 TaxID=3126506 RepID=UPI0030A70C8D
MTGRIIMRCLASHEVGSITLIDAIEREVDGGQELTLFLDAGVNINLITPPDKAKLIAASQIAGAPILTYRLPAGAKRTFVFGEATLDIVPAEAESHVFEGANAIIATRNGETAQTVIAWLNYHVAIQGLQVAIILDRARPGTDGDFVRELHDCDPACDIVLVKSDVPLGRRDLPPEAHPFCVPEAPGKDRMIVPAPSPWDSPLRAVTWYEIARRRFLLDARAIANIDVHDLIRMSDRTVFDQSIVADGGLIRLEGRHCYPWRVKPDEPVLFADHICVQFDATGGRQRWCIAPAKAPENTILRLLRVGNAVPDPAHIGHFDRHMAMRHPTDSISKIVPKTSLIEDEALLARSKEYFGHDPVPIPTLQAPKINPGRGRRAIVTTMKNEGPFILEWLAYHRAIGFDDILIYTNDCTDGTDTMLQMLMNKGYVQHRHNRFREMNLKPQHAALQMAEDEAVISDAKWVTCIDVDEFVNIKTGDGTLDALFDAVPDANMIAMTWRLFGNANVHDFVDRPITEQFLRCAPELARKPHQAWGFKTLFQNIGLFKKLGVHRPKGLNPQLWEMINWVNGSGTPLPRDMYRNGWRSTTETYGYDLVQLNHYAVRSAESFLVKRDRGRVNHVDRDQGLAYWFRMNNNFEEDRSIIPRLPMMQAELDLMLADPDIVAAHANAVAAHRTKILELRETANYARFFETLTSTRQEKLSCLHSHFGANVFLAGPEVVPDEITDKDPKGDWFFTVENQGDTAH